MIKIQQIHHVAYRCKDAKETADFYQKYLNMDLTVCIAEDKVPSTQEPDPYMHIFLDAGMGNILAFFEIT
ncbi:MAG: VOC family protein, partial [Bdellovibrionales bacterium]|nr:VOC family protein [Bdellovibrionales bacterium]